MSPGLPRRPTLVSKREALYDRRRTGPAFSLQEIPFCYSGSWFNFSPVIAEKTHADDIHLVSHQTGLHPVLRLVPVEVGGDRQRQHTAVSATPALLTWRHPRGVISLAYESQTPSGSPAPGWTCSSPPRTSP